MKNLASPPLIHKEAFIAAREQLGLSIKELSQKTCLSVRQIEQIEDGGQNSFYSANIKFTAAKKVAKLLKLSPEQAFDFGDLVSQMPAVEKPSEPISDGVKATFAPVVAVEATKKLKPAKTFHSPSVKKKKWLPILGLLAVTGFALVSLQPSFFSAVTETAVTPVEELKAESATASTPPETPAEASLQTNPSPIVAAAPIATVASSPAVECPVADASVASFRADAPKKSADMVYLVAKTPQVVCVLDATGKSQSKQLESGIGASVYGKAPLKVLTAGLTQVDLYFQGVKVRPSNPIANTIMLEPAPLNTIKGEADSELR
ncbi:helix-turn-helix domain-containing protein [Polynucleobacter paludilacus]|uniref:helix-turn-helix domain-containing protein n=1 Tax=Polynucleobacter paludilacus TaxID=1855895 RepID=UPI001BFE3674|nr:helix-turn-helix domain-containing protein [Polynucleobacter paludilacus]QWD87488.1 helix-turn-helix domain-containing protein [Polynucleobacter paludilacus]